MSHVGETSRKLETRLNEHTKPSKSVFGSHLYIAGYSFSSPGKVQLIHEETRDKKLFALIEAIEINKHLRNNNIRLLNEDRRDLPNKYHFTISLLYEKWF